MASRRWTISVVMAIVAAALILLTVPALFVRAQVLNTDRYVETVAPLAADPVLQAEIAQQVTDRITAAANVEQFARDSLTELTGDAPRLEPLIESLVPVIADQTRERIDDAAARLVTTPEFQELWVAANREAHQRLIGLLTGEPVGVVGIDDSGTVTISTTEVIERVKARLVQEGVAVASRIPEVEGEVILFESPELARVGQLVAVLDRGALILAGLALATTVAAIAVAPRGSRRRAVGVLGFGTAVTMALLALGLALGRAYYLNAIPDDRITPEAAERLIDTLLSPLQLSIRWIFAVALLVTLIAFLVGRSPAARGIRRGMVRVGDHSTGRAESEEIRPWQRRLALSCRAVQAAVVGTALAVLVLWPEPTVAVGLWITVAAGMVVLAIEVLARPVMARGDPPDRVSLGNE